MIAAVDSDALLELVWAAPLAVLAVTVAWGMVVHGSTRGLEAQRDGRAVTAGAHFAVAVAGAALFTAAVVFGLIVVTSKG
jgi:hypothetical protein